MALTFSPDPVHLAAGAGTAAAQTASPRLVADHANGGWDAAPIVATGATSGQPGTFTPAGATPPATLAALQSGGITASPATKWPVGDYVTLGNATLASWSGSAWVAGASPVVASRAEKSTQ